MKIEIPVSAGSRPASVKAPAKSGRGGGRGRGGPGAGPARQAKPQDGASRPAGKRRRPRRSKAA